MDPGDFLSQNDSTDFKKSIIMDQEIDVDPTESDLLTAAADAERHYKEENPEPEETKSPQEKQALESDDDKEGSSEDEAEQRESDGSPEIMLKRQSGKRKISEECIKMLEAADVLRRSARNRKGVQRLAVGLSSDDDEKPRRRGRRITRKSSPNWGASDSENGSDSSDSNFSEPKRRITRRTARKKQNRRKIVESSDEEWSEDSDYRRSTRIGRGARSRVDYKEASSEEVNSEDVLEWEDDVVASTSKASVGSEVPCETIEKVLKRRIGRRGATGPPTTCYNVEDKGDPNCLQDAGDTEQQFLIKWVGWAHIHNTWESEETLRQSGVKGLKKLENYINRANEIDAWKNTADKESIEYFDCEQEMSEELCEQYKQAERIIAINRVKDKEKGIESTDYFIKWLGLPYAESTWEDGSLIARWFQDKIDQFQDRISSKRTPTKYSAALKKRPKFVLLKEQPEFVGRDKNLQLRDYQLDGVNWLLQAWCRWNSVILADEMGLGKTIQTISFLNVLYNEHEVYGPFLVVVPLSTMAAWQREWEQWAQEMNVIVYLGDVSSRDLIRQYEWCTLPQRRIKFNACLTTYEILLKDKAFLGSIDWAVLMVDEAHRLKNDESLLYRALMDFKTNHRLLITGTPLQNSLKELWALLHFIMREKFDCWEDFEVDHGGSDKKAFSSLHEKLEPYLLRRVKKDVEKSLPAKVEQILRVDLTAIQKQYYKWILTKNYRALSKGVKGSISGFLNLMMELKKCCNHSFLVRQPDSESADPQERLQQIIKSSGKLILLDKLLIRMEQAGHRVLIFSQMVMLLDILQEYLRLRKFPFQRLDGSMRGDLRRQALDHFNSEGSTDFCFLLSTKAGGLGINLATADTVIIFDSDWNPQNDLQAQSRAHRIGQTKQVNIYRLVSKGSVEEDIVERAKRKLVLDHLVIQRMDTTGRTILSKNAVSSSGSVPFDKQELASILKFGAEELFKEKEGEEEEPEVDIDDILQRAETREMDNQLVRDELLDAFKYANFSIDEEEEIELKPKPETNPPDEKEWEEIIPEEERKKMEEKERLEMEMQLQLPPRQRNKIQQLARNEDSDEDWEKSRKKRKRGEDSDSSDSSDDERPRKRVKKTALLGFTESEIRKFVKAFKRFAQPMSRLEAIACDAELEEHSSAELAQLGDALIKGCKQAVLDYEQQSKLPQNDTEGKKKDRGPVCKLGPVEVAVRPLLKTQADLEPLYQVMPENAHERKHFNVPNKPKALKNWDVEWDENDDAALLRGIYEYGLGSWESIKMDPELGLNEKILVTDKNKKPQVKHIQSRADYLLRFLQKHQRMEKGQLLRPTRDLDALITSVITTTSVVNEKPKKEPKTSKKAKKGTDEAGKKRTKNEKLKKLGKQRKSEIEEGELEGEKKAVPVPKKDTKVANPLVTAKTDHLDVRSRYSQDLEDSSSKLFVECVELMRPASKSIKKIAMEDSVDDLNQHLLRIGDHIQECLVPKAKNEKALEKWLSYLWIFVAKFTKSEASKWRKQYREISKNRNIFENPKVDEIRDKKHQEHKHRHHRDKTDGNSHHHHKQHHHHHHHSHRQGVASTSAESHKLEQKVLSSHDEQRHKPDFAHKKEELSVNYRNSPVNSRPPWHHSRYEEPRYNKLKRGEKSYNDLPNPNYQRNVHQQDFSHRSDKTGSIENSSRRPAYGATGNGNSHFPAR